MQTLTDAITTHEQAIETLQERLGALRRAQEVLAIKPVQRQAATKAGTGTDGRGRWVRTPAYRHKMSLIAKRRFQQQKQG